MNLPSNKSAYLFDLDNTLYRETDYLFAAYSAIASFIHTRSGIDIEKVKTYIINEFKSNGRDKLLNKTIEKFELNPADLNTMLEILRTCNPGPISLLPDAYQVLRHLMESTRKIAIITNGNIRQQKNKVHHILWKELKDYIEVVYANEHERKPSPASINFYLDKYAIKTSDAVFVGDSKEDKQAARAAGVEFIQSTFKVN